MNITNDLQALSIDRVAQNSWFNQKKWLIVGTGPTINKWNQDLAKEYNIWTINTAINHTQYADIAALHDNVIYTNIKKYIQNDFESRYILTRTPNIQTESNTCYVQLECDVKCKDLGLKTYQTVNSSAFAFLFLGERFKEIYSIGIDGGKTVSELMPKFYQEEENGQNFNAHNGFIPIFQKKFGFKHIKL